MIHRQGMWRCAFAVATAVGALAGCTSSPGIDAPGSPSGTGSATTTRAGSTDATTSTGGTASPTAFSCGTPPSALVERAGMSIAAHPGQITATTYVFAATTDTGDWYVLGIDRSYVHDDGSPGAGPEGDQSRSLALTNRARTTDGAVAMIPLSVAVSERLPVSWDRVSWTGDTLAAGKRAADRAIACLEDQRRA